MSRKISKNSSVEGGDNLVLDNIKILCKENKISIASLEQRLGIGNGTIGRWDKSSPTTDKIKAVADYFGCTIDDLLSEQHNKTAVR